MTHTKHERTLVILKPDGVQRGLIGEIISRFERVGLKIIGLKLEVPSAEKVKHHYAGEPGWLAKAGQKSIDSYLSKGKTPPSLDPVEIGEKVLGHLVRYMTSGPAILMVLQGAHAVPVVRKLVGSTEPLSSDVGTIRGDFVIDSYELSDVDGRSVRNLIHASGTKDEAEKEIEFWFKKEELIKYKLVQEQILYDVNLDGILE